MVKVIFLAIFFLTNPIIAGESASNRNGKTAHFQAGFGLLGQGYGLGYFISPDYRIDVSSSSLSIDFLSIKTSLQVTKAELQMFLGNSFYVSLGATSETIRIEDSGLFTSSADLYKATMNRLGPHVAIGNEWQWSYFLLGCEWIGSMQPVSSSFDVTFPSSFTESDREIVNQDLDEISETRSNSLLNLYFGFSF